MTFVPILSSLDMMDVHADMNRRDEHLLDISELREEARHVSWVHKVRSAHKVRLVIPEVEIATMAELAYRMLVKP